VVTLYGKRLIAEGVIDEDGFEAMKAEYRKTLDADFAVAEDCNRYDDRTKPSLWDLRQMAWVLRTDSKRQKLGFIRAKEWERQNEDGGLLPPHLS
jgi:2-oxoglutarate dehydrogenase complex dehydrogenase (E1) component-like enzyme